MVTCDPGLGCAAASEDAGAILGQPGLERTPEGGGEGAGPACEWPGQDR